MHETRYGLQVSISVPYDEAVKQATEALKAQGFGVLTTIDVKQTPSACRPTLAPLADRHSPASRAKRISDYEPRCRNSNDRNC